MIIWETWVILFGHFFDPQSSPIEKLLVKFRPKFLDSYVSISGSSYPYLSVLFENQRCAAKLPYKKGNPYWAMEWRHKCWILWFDVVCILYFDWYLALYCCIVILSLFCYFVLCAQGGYSQNFLQKFVRIFVTLGLKILSF